MQIKEYQNLLNLEINSNSNAMAFADQGFDPSRESYEFVFII